jgi:phage terminase small subunit
MSESKPLTKKERLFVEEYLKDLNGTAAAIRAGYSNKSARAIASENLTKPNISLAVKAALDDRAKQIQIDAHMVLAELKKIAMADITQAYDSSGWLKPLNEIPEDVRAAISSLEVQEIFRVRAKTSQSSELQRRSNL